MNQDQVTWRPIVDVYKFTEIQTNIARSELGVYYITHADFQNLGIEPYEVTHEEGNLVTTAGLARITNLLTGSGGQTMLNTTVRTGVGNGSCTAAVGDTDLAAAAGSANRQFKVMDATFPSGAGTAVLTFKSSFQTGEANFVWNEWGLDVGTATVTDGTTVNALLFNHKCSAALGTKTSGIWALTVTATFA